MSRPTPPSYKTRNWPAYNEALKRRGSLTIWFDPEMSWEAAPTGRRGRQQSYSDAAIQTCLSMKVLFGMALTVVGVALGVAAGAVQAAAQDNTWYVGGMTDWNARTLTIDLGFLGEGAYTAELFRDGVNADKAARDYKRESVEIPADRKLTVKMAPGGGFALKVSRK